MKTILILDRSSDSIFDRANAAVLVETLNQRGEYQVVRPELEGSIVRLLDDYPHVMGVMLNWYSMGSELFGSLEDLNEELPFFLLTEDAEIPPFDIPAGALTYSFIKLPCSVKKTAAKIDRAVRRYQSRLLPPFTRGLFKFADAKKNTFCTPGHLLGAAYRHHPLGRAFFDFFGPNTFRADTSISVPDMGSLLDHTGPHKDAEELIAKAFNADRSYIITNGTSTANKVVGMYCAHAGETMLVDRNCHKSICHLLMMCDVTPIYLRPTRNAYGMIGGIPAKEFTSEAILRKLNEREDATWPRYAVISNSTYDGLLYDVDWIKANLPVKQIHFDSAWTPYAPFNPIYANKFGMSGPATPGKVVFETQSAHKMLASFAQASFVHVKGEFDPQLLNETYMMHTTTSPHYGIVASAEVGAAMMTGNLGRRLLQNSIDQAMEFRREVARLHRESDSWFFNVWQPEDISETKCWPISRGENWHGFLGADEDFNYLDPIRVTVLTPGMGPDGQLNDWGIPAEVVSKYLNAHGVVTEKTGPYTMLFLFALGVDDMRTAAVIRALKDFKRDYDADVPIREALPDLFKQDPIFYMPMTLRQLCRGLHRLMRKYDLPKMMYHAFEELPTLEYTPYQAFQKALRGETEDVYLEDLKDKVSAGMILPYPPGVPLIMPGEKVTDKSSSVLEFLMMLTEIGAHFPGFETDIHGAYRQKDGRYTVKVLTEE